MRTLTAVLVLGLVSGALNAQEAYEIGPGDVLRISVLGQTEMTGEMPVDS
jgi:protein involved in polysaccharide export with SLBB domain